MTTENQKVKQKKELILKKLEEHRKELELQKQIVLEFEGNFFTAMSKITEDFSVIKQRINQHLALIDEVLDEATGKLR